MAKIKVISAPKQRPPAKGGYSNQSGWALDTGGRVFDPTLSYHNPFATSGPLQPVPEEMSDLEAENGESVVADFDGDGIKEFKTIGGKRHSEGGTPLNLPSNSFIFSDTQKMKIKDPEILSLFDAGTKAKTPAEISKKYDLTKYKAILANPDSDNLQRSTAERMMMNFGGKLQQLAIVQEAKKGFKGGVPNLQSQINDNSNPQSAKLGGYFQPGGSTSQDIHNTFFPNVLGNGSNDMFGRYNPYYKYPTNGNSDNNTGSPVVDPNTPMQSRKVKVIKTPDNRPEISWDYMANEFNPTINHQDFTWQGLQNDLGKVDNKEDDTPNYYSNIKDHSDNTPSPNEIGDVYSYNPPYGISNADRLSQLSSLFSAANVRKYPNYVAPAKFQKPDVTFMSPERELAANAEQANSQSMVSALSSDGARQRAIDSSIQGQALSNVGNILSKTQGANVEISNRANQMAADIANKQAEFNSNRLNELYKQGVISDQQYRNAQNQAAANIARTNQQVQANASKLAWINSMHNRSPYYIDPLTQRPMYNKNYVPDIETGMEGASDEQVKSALSTRAAQIMSEGYVSDKQEAYKLAHQEMMQNRIRRTYNPFTMGNQRYMQTYNPAFQNEYGMEGMYGNGYGMGYQMGPGYGY